jgi:hypothetical protein
MKTDRTRIAWLSPLVVLGLATGEADAQQPASPPSVPVRKVGRLRRAVRHTAHTLRDTFIGIPDAFVEPPLGASINETFGVMTARAEPHEFTLYRSDFVAGTTDLSPRGTDRIQRMATRLPGWLGPIFIEPTPDLPVLAEARKAAVTTAFQRGGLAVGPDRVVIAPNPFQGLLGVNAASNHAVMLHREQNAPSQYSLPPNSGATLNSGGVNGGH